MNCAEYETSDKVMVIALLMAGHRPTEIREDKDSQLVYVFDDAAVKTDVDRLRLGHGEDMTFTYGNYWAAEATWQMNLRHSSRRRR